MSLSFNKLKSPLLGLQDQIPFGKFKGCRLCDIVQDQYEYLIWAEKQGLVKFQPVVVETIQEMASFARWEQHVEEEIKPFLEDDLIRREREMMQSILEDDVPF